MCHPEKFQSKQSSGTSLRRQFLIIYSGLKPDSTLENGGSELLHSRFVKLEGEQGGDGVTSDRVPREPAHLCREPPVSGTWRDCRGETSLMMSQQIGDSPWGLLC